jgi:hypothetical protein
MLITVFSLIMLLKVIYYYQYIYMIFKIFSTKKMVEFLLSIVFMNKIV